MSPESKKSIGRDFTVKVTGTKDIAGYISASNSLGCDSRILEINPLIDDIPVGMDVVDVTLASFTVKISYDQAIKNFDSAGFKPVPFSVFLDFVVQNIGVVNFVVPGETTQMSNKKPRVVCLSKILTKTDQKMTIISFYRTQINTTSPSPYLFIDYVYYTDEHGKLVNNTWENNNEVRTAFLVMKK